MGATTRPLGVEVYKLADFRILDEWKQPECPVYTGFHGLKMPPRDDDESGYVGQSGITIIDFGAFDASDLLR